MKFRLMLALALSFACFGTWSVARADEKTPAAPKPPFREAMGRLKGGQPIPDFTFLTAEGKEVKFSDYARGKTVVLDFWATWCGPCQQAMPHYEEIHRKYRDQGVLILGLCSFDTQEAYAKWLKVHAADYTFPTGFDPAGKPATGDKAALMNTVMAKLSGGLLSPLPTTVVVDSAGKLVGSYMGYAPASADALANLLMLAGVKVAPADQPKVFFPAGSTVKPKPAAGLAAGAAAKTGEPVRLPFHENYAALKAGEPVPDFAAQDAAGAAVQFHDFARGHIVVLSFWAASHGIPDDALAFADAWAQKYAAQGVRFVSVGAYGTHDEYAQWLAAHGAKVAFPVWFDPAGKGPARPATMTEAERQTFRAEAHEYYTHVIPMRLAGGAMAPVPHSLVIDAQGRLVGIFVGAGAKSAEALGNLLLRAGVKLAPEDQPMKVYTAAETKEAPPEARVDLLKIGAIAPDFPATDLNGQAVKVSDYRGHVVILDFWATWCGPCLASMPHTQEVAAHYKDQGVVVLASCTSDSRAKFEAWMKHNQEKYPDILFSHDPLERSPDRASRKLYGVPGIPQQFVIDRSGRVVALVTGYLKGETILEAALAKAGVKVDPALVAKGEADLRARETMR